MHQLEFTFTADLDPEESDFAFVSDGKYSAVYIDGAWRNGLSKFSCDINAKNTIGDLELKFNTLNIMQPTFAPDINNVFELKIKNNITKIYVNGKQIGIVSAVNVLAEPNSTNIEIKFGTKAPGFNIPWIKETQI